MNRLQEQLTTVLKVIYCPHFRDYTNQCFKNSRRLLHTGFSFFECLVRERRYSIEKVQDTFQSQRNICRQKLIPAYGFLQVQQDSRLYKLRIQPMPQPQEAQIQLQQEHSPQTILPTGSETYHRTEDKSQPICRNLMNSLIHSLSKQKDPTNKRAYHRHS